MNKTILIGILVAGILAIGLTTAYAGPTNPMINLQGDVTVDGTLSNAAISTEITNVVTELQALTGAVQGISSAQGPIGATGVTGMTGVTGPTVTLSSQRLEQFFNIPPNNNIDVTVSCPPNTILIGGGVANLSLETKVISNYPLQTDTWKFAARNEGTSNVQVAVFILCLSQ